jgi:hypothetical protein
MMLLQSWYDIHVIIKPKTLSSILEQAGLTANELRELLWNWGMKE